MLISHGDLRRDQKNNSTWVNFIPDFKDEKK